MSKSTRIVATEIDLDRELGEFHVKAYRLTKDGNIVRYAACDYFTDCIIDAKNTALVMRSKQEVKESYS